VKRLSDGVIFTIGDKLTNADCLNNGKHEWKKSTTFPVEFTRMYCSICDEQRNPTTDEITQIINDRSKA